MHPTLAHVNRQLEREAEGIAYKGHLIRFNALAGLYNVSRDGFHLTAQMSMDGARNAVDQLTRPHSSLHSADEPAEETVSTVNRYATLPGW